MDQYQLSREGPTNDEMRIIGIELAVTPHWRGEVELYMDGMSETIPYHVSHNTETRITVHTSNGDITARFPLRPGNYRCY